ncbi:hypothetical protein EVAR_75471_1 [Eumeta japonica]|uniref:Uncharacterized protein n=1 Tax=Eumeta variegata TaxID=151549 RepID=A0A4C1TK64_EUMVA|nr:hypothetical protein EVAR_75471_1 [Eumeta japonica]
MLRTVDKTRTNPERSRRGSAAVLTRPAKWRGLCPSAEAYLAQPASVPKSRSVAKIVQLKVSHEDAKSEPREESSSLRERVS